MVIKRQSFLRNREALSFCIYVVAMIIFNKSNVPKLVKNQGRQSEEKYAKEYIPQISVKKNAVYFENSK